jgi:hypothetical protein
MKSSNSVSRHSVARAENQISVIRQALAKMTYVCSGTVQKRMKVCGKAHCRCARVRSARHGPYYEWTYWRRGRIHHRAITKVEAGILRKGIANLRKVKRLLRLWEEQTLDLAGRFRL